MELSIWHLCIPHGREFPVFVAKFGLNNGELMPNFSLENVVCFRNRLASIYS